MNAVTDLRPRGPTARGAQGRVVAKQTLTLDEHVVEIMSDSGEGAQKCGQSFGAIAARSMKAFLGLRDTDFVYQDRPAGPDALLFGIDRAEHGYARVRLPR